MNIGDISTKFLNFNFITYSKLMDSNINNYGMLVEFKTKSFLDSNSHDAKNNIKNTEILIKKMLVELEKYMEFLVADKAPEMKKFGYYVISILYYRSFGSSNAKELFIFIRE